MKATLVRVGVDQAFGGWNAPVDPDTNEFVYVPIPDDVPFQPGLATPYDDLVRAVQGLAGGSIALPPKLRGRNMHLDPDFSHLTYGDNGERRGRGIAGFEAGDLVVFFAGLRPIRPCAHRLLYAIIGLYRVAETARLGDVLAARWHENAHTRRLNHRASDVIVRADPQRSGRLRRCIPIGEWRDRAYRVRHDLLEQWGGLSCRDGFIQRSAVPPMIGDPLRFLQWFEGQRPELLAANNPEMREDGNGS